MPYELAVLVEDPDREDAPRDTLAEAELATLQIAEDEAVRGVVLGRRPPAAERAGAADLEPRRDAERVVHVLARRHERARPGLELVQAHRAGAPRVADRDGGQARGGIVARARAGTRRVAAVEERVGVHDVDDALERGAGGAAARTGRDGFARAGSVEAAACKAPERRVPLRAAGGSGHRRNRMISRHAAMHACSQLARRGYTAGEALCKIAK